MSVDCDRSSPGLSPRVRRHLARTTAGRPLRRSISACAEAPTARRGRMVTLRVYLRVCGGTDGTVFNGNGSGGLSPRVRRHPREHSLLCFAPGSISACAEAPQGSTFTTERREVYLRVCGGTGYSTPSTEGIRGLSPRVRRHPAIRCQTGDISTGKMAGLVQKSNPYGALARSTPVTCTERSPGDPLARPSISRRSVAATASSSTRVTERWPRVPTN